VYSSYRKSAKKLHRLLAYLKYIAETHRSKEFQITLSIHDKKLVNNLQMKQQYRKTKNKLHEIFKKLNTKYSLKFKLINKYSFTMSSLGIRKCFQQGKIMIQNDNMLYSLM
jgi:UDP-N-acetylglucosamine 2-epimerase